MATPSKKKSPAKPRQTKAKPAGARKWSKKAQAAAMNPPERVKIHFTDGTTTLIPFFRAEQNMRIPCCCECGANIVEVVKMINSEGVETEHNFLSEMWFEAK